MKKQGTREQENEGTREQGPERVESLLRQALPRIGDESEQSHDLWPAMRERLRVEALAPKVRVPWFDWALIGALAALIVAFPAAIPMLLYYL